jgi:RNA polymerase sigma-70 factor (ECF subfamily)
MGRVSANDRVPPGLDLVEAEPENWVEALSAPGPGQDRAMDRLHQMLLRASRHQVRRMRSTLAGVGDERLEEIANQAADEAMMAVLAKLSTFEGRSRFTTWAYKFAILQPATEVRRFAWQHREVELDDNAQLQAHGPSPASYAEAADLASAVRNAIDVAPRTSVGSPSPCSSTTSQSTFSPNGSARTATPCTRPSTTREPACAPT